MACGGFLSMGILAQAGVYLEEILYLLSGEGLCLQFKRLFNNQE